MELSGIHAPTLLHTSPTLWWSNVVLRFKYATEISTQHILTTLEITESKTLNQISKHIAVCAQCNQSYFEVAVERFASNLV